MRQVLARLPRLQPQPPPLRLGRPLGTHRRFAAAAATPAEATHTLLRRQCASGTAAAAGAPALCARPLPPRPRAAPFVSRLSRSSAAGHDAPQQAGAQGDPAQKGAAQGGGPAPKPGPPPQAAPLIRLATFNVLAPCYKRLGDGRRESSIVDAAVARQEAAAALLRAEAGSLDVLALQEYWCAARADQRCGGAYLVAPPIFSCLLVPTPHPGSCCSAIDPAALTPLSFPSLPCLFPPSL